MTEEQNFNENKKLIYYAIKIISYRTTKTKCYIQNSYYDIEDLFQIGSIGLLKAIRLFDNSRNIAFSTYAITIIKNTILSQTRKREFKTNDNWYFIKNDDLDIIDEQDSVEGFLNSCSVQQQEILNLRANKHTWLQISKIMSISCFKCKKIMNNIKLKAYEKNIIM